MAEAVILLGALGFLCAVLMTAIALLAGGDDKTQELREALPGYNCGACGYAGCGAYAEALSAGEKRGLCRPGGEKVRNKIEEILG